jgi:hypothetical protein
VAAPQSVDGGCGVVAQPRRGFVPAAGGQVVEVGERTPHRGVGGTRDQSRRSVGRAAVFLSGGAARRRAR